MLVPVPLFELRVRFHFRLGRPFPDSVPKAQVESWSWSCSGFVLPQKESSRVTFLLPKTGSLGGGPKAKDKIAPFHLVRPMGGGQGAL